MDRKKGAGILIPVFSLRSREGLGIGEFSDLILLSDFAEKSGISLIQLLPVFDTSVTKTWTDSYCYSSISMFALHPIYLRIEKAFSKIPLEVLQEINEKKRSLNALDEVDYETVYREKINFSLRLYNEEINSVPSEFIEKNADWLPAYAAFCTLRDAFGSSNFFTWPMEYRVGTKAVVDALCSPSSSHYKKIRFYYFLQLKLDEQFKEASEYALKKGIQLKGDFPVGMNVYSAETWTNPDLFVLGRRIGAPPDYFNPKGQNWELPAYNWEIMKKASYDWFVRRLRHMQRYCQLVRIDHVLGYFRFWEIPEQYSRGALGYFNPSLSIALADLPVKMQQNIARYTDPYISEELLTNCFGKEKEKIKSLFFEEGGPGGYIFKMTYLKQKQIDVNPSVTEKQKNILHEIYENILLVKDSEQEGFFYPRIGFESTSSFSALHEEEKEYYRSLFAIYSCEEEEKIWKKEGLEKLKCFQGSTSMEICAEDLGMLPKCTQEVLEKLGFLRLHVQRMPKNEEEEFSLPSEYEYLSVCSPSNHDTSTLRLWWKEDSEITQRYYENVLGGNGKAPQELTESLCQKIIQMHLDSDCKWAIILMQDLLALHPALKNKNAENERINDPSIHPFYWRWRLHISLEDLINENVFCSFLRSLVELSKRGKNA